MRTNLLAASALFLAGCQTTPVIKPLPDLPPLRGKADNYADRALRESAPASPEMPGAASGEKFMQQAQVIEPARRETSGPVYHLGNRNVRASIYGSASGTSRNDAAPFYAWRSSRWNWTYISSRTHAGGASIRNGSCQAGG